jgi:hypothetical protein
MKHPGSPKFRLFYTQLTGKIRRLADENYKPPKVKSRHPFLRFKEVGRMSSVRADIHYRARAVSDGYDFFWFWIGRHRECDHSMAESLKSEK